MISELISRLEAHFPEEKISINIDFHSYPRESGRSKFMEVYLHMGDIAKFFGSFAELDRFAEKLICENVKKTSELLERK